MELFCMLVVPTVLWRDEYSFCLKYNWEQRHSGQSVISHQKPNIARSGNKLNTAILCPSHKSPDPAHIYPNRHLWINQFMATVTPARASKAALLPQSEQHSHLKSPFLCSVSLPHSPLIVFISQEGLTKKPLAWASSQRPRKLNHLDAQWGSEFNRWT